MRAAGPLETRQVGEAWFQVGGHFGEVLGDMEVFRKEGDTRQTKEGREPQSASTLRETRHPP